jgi:hypothetical protein
VVVACHWAAAVIQGDLGNRPKDVFANRLERDGLRKEHWCDARTKDIRDPALGSGETEHAIGGRDQPPGKADPFRLVTVEQIVGRMAGQNRRQLPGKIDGVANCLPMPAARDIIVIGASAGGLEALCKLTGLYPLGFRRPS